MVEFEEKIIPSIEKFQPQLMIISAGFDAHFKDPTGTRIEKR